MENMTPYYFSNIVAEGVYLIGCDLQNPLTGENTGHRIAPQGPTGNSYLIVGTKHAVLIDSMENVPGIREYAESIANVPVRLVLSHAHFDHIYRLCEFDEVWMHPDDQKLLHGHAGFPVYKDIPETIHDLRGGDVIDLGGRLLDVISIAGHTDGSLMFLDRQTNILFSGDSIARRILYGTDRWVPIEQFVAQLKDVKKLDFDRILTAHDRVFFYPYLIEDIIAAFTGINEQTPVKSMPYGSFIHILQGDEHRLDHLNISINLKYKDEVLASAKKLREEQ